MRPGTEISSTLTICQPAGAGGRAFFAIWSAAVIVARSAADESLKPALHGASVRAPGAASIAAVARTSAPSTSGSGMPWTWTGATARRS